MRERDTMSKLFRNCHVFFFSSSILSTHQQVEKVCQLSDIWEDIAHLDSLGLRYLTAIIRGARDSSVIESFP